MRKQKTVYIYICMEWRANCLLLEDCRPVRVSSLGGCLVWPLRPLWAGFHRYSVDAVEPLIQGAGVHPPHLTACKYIGLYIIIMSANHSFRSLHSIHFRPSVTNHTLSANRCVLPAAAAAVSLSSVPRGIHVMLSSVVI